MSDFSFLDDLNEEQREAATAEFNAVVSAGAGSGKTKSLAARYLWLIMQGGCKVEEILTITFMNKAANEMYSRIYTLLAENAGGNPHAALAVKHFYRANIHTLDSFCASVARTASRRFGVSPDFVSDNERVGELARQAALRFVLDKRGDPALQRLIAEKKIRTVADELFAEPMLRYSSVSRPLDFDAFKTGQKAALLEQWELLTKQAEYHTGTLLEELNHIKKEKSFYTNLSGALKNPRQAPGIAELFERDKDRADLRENIIAYFDFLRGICLVRMTSSAAEEYVQIKKSRAALKEELYPRLEAAANNALQWDIVEAVFPLMSEFQEQFNNKKREAGTLSFFDIARLALDALSRYPDIRQVYKQSIKKIMIDEFQDNNSLQRDLIFLLAEKPERDSPGVPPPEELLPGKVFFVGDEKQSIFRFRGADVSVFRRLAGDIGGGLTLSRNYRSHPMLIRAFNRIFGGFNVKNDPEPLPGIFPLPGKETAEYEASYRWTESRDAGSRETSQVSAETPRLHFAFLDEDQKDEENCLGSEELEAAFIAQKIRTMVKHGVPVYDKHTKENRPCGYGDFAVLQRSYSRQHALEKQCKLFGVPFSANRPAGLFNEAPVNDLCALLRLVIYPEDRIAYGALLRSPFVRLSDSAFALCMTGGFRPPPEPRSPVPSEPFDERLDECMPPEDLDRYRRGRELFRAVREDAQNLSVAELLTKLWYDEGYRYETLWSASSQAYGDLYDLLFELARHIDERGGGLCEFIDYLDRLAGGEEKYDDMDLNDEAGGIRIMSIHKCKGLEFPVVFVFGCGKIERSGSRPSLSSYSETWGLFLNLPQAEELPGKGGSYFSLLEKEEDRLKEEAELKRLLYVAMTRAESELYVTGVLKKQSGGEAPSGAYGEEYLRERLVQLRDQKRTRSLSFLKFLLPVLATAEDPPYTIEPIPVFTRDELYRLAGTARAGAPAQPESMEEAAAAASPLYEKAPVPPHARPVPLSVAASSLHVPWSPPADDRGSAEDDEVDALLEKAGLDPSGFGTIVHGFIENRFNGQKEEIPPRFLASCGESLIKPLEEKARALVDSFFASPLGRLAAASSFVRTEYPVLTAVNVPPDPETPDGPRSGPLLISGKIDLLFEGPGALYVVDFKTDRTEDRRQHIGQLAVYRRAVSDIFGMLVQCRLYYLRSGRNLDLTAEAGKTSPEELAAYFLRGT
jgi:ATP-dependent helicase/nuclease subunit A